MTKTIKNLWIMVEYLRGSRNDTRPENLKKAAENYAQGALLTMQGVESASDHTAEGTVPFTKTAFQVLDRWMTKYAVNHQFGFRTRETLSKAD